MTDALDAETLDSDIPDSGCVDDSSDPVGSDDSSGDDACSDSWSDDDSYSDDRGSDDACSDDRAGADSGDDAAACDDGADARGTDDGDDGACDTDPACWDDTLSAVPTDEMTATSEVAEVAPSTSPAPLVALPAAALASLPNVAPVSPFAGVPGLGGDTEAILGSVSRQIADAGTVAHAPLGVSDPAADAALIRADVVGRASGSMAAVAAQQEIVNSVREHELRRSTVEESIRAQGAAERAEDGLL